MRKRVEVRYAVLALFEKGGRIVLRDYSNETSARCMAYTLRNRDLFPGRPYHIEVQRNEMEVEDDWDFHTARRLGD